MWGGDGGSAVGSQESKAGDSRHNLSGKKRRCSNSSSEENNSTIKLTGGHALPPSMVELWEEGTLCDVNVNVGGLSFKAHRLVLAAGSDYVALLIRERRFADSTGPIELPEMCARASRLG